MCQPETRKQHAYIYFRSQGSFHMFFASIDRQEKTTLSRIPKDLNGPPTKKRWQPSSKIFKGFAMNVQVKHHKNRWDYHHPKLNPFQGDVQKSDMANTPKRLSYVSIFCPLLNLQNILHYEHISKSGYQKPLPRPSLWSFPTGTTLSNVGNPHLT